MGNEKHFICGNCRGQFHKSVWHCDNCNRHWDYRKKRCPFCRYDRRVGCVPSEQAYELAKEQEEVEEEMTATIELGEIASFPCTWQGSEVKVKLLRNHDGKIFVDFRIHTDMKSDKDLPTKRGFRVSIDNVEELFVAITNLKAAIDMMKENA